MNIREHIEAGNYPRDGKGRSIIATDNPSVRVLIAATDAPGDWLLGWATTRTLDGTQDYCWSIGWWKHDGEPVRSEAKHRLLPPPPRKVKVTATMRVLPGRTPALMGWATDPTTAEIPDGHIVELTGEYEQEWE